MNIFTDILFLFVYIFAMLYLEMPNINGTDYPIHKLYMFISIFSYYFIVQIIKKIKNKCPIDALAIIQDCLIVSLFCVLGYSIYVDLKYWNYTKDIMTTFNGDDFTTIIKKYVMVAIIIVSFVTMVQFIKILFTGSLNECDQNVITISNNNIISD